MLPSGSATSAMKLAAYSAFNDVWRISSNMDQVYRLRRTQIQERLASAEAGGVPSWLPRPVARIFIVASHMELSLFRRPISRLIMV